MRLLPGLCAAALLAGPLAAQGFTAPVVSDLDGDGAAETFTLLDSGDGTADLRIEAGRSVIHAESIAWKGGIGQEPELAVLPNGSVQVISMNEAIGRSRWRQALTIAHRDGAYRVAGITYGWYDTIDNTGGTCDFNLLTGRGIIERDDGSRREVAAPLPALPVTEFRDDTFTVPEGCY
ncbi:hypothetical protein OG2516_12226 [Oceanicola granulosus HTCC2516]|uniref:VCBS repeat-containing protein n=1 Tax=Oceanicola granulosus (strain ATCC BAA-861 / DSM 15982 / KCTC 12143 / HTCC2516) TaxID=314256 RepID=Q2CD63_OCEGH|nr:hypothetical protein [Oceanicola granulosus]EAR50615.1 hypothetical protein OG2516_12226 [Oceanicola granulosus HTCC2516]